MQVHCAASTFLQVSVDSCDAYLLVLRGHSGGFSFGSNTQCVPLSFVCAEKVFSDVSAAQIRWRGYGPAVRRDGPTYHIRCGQLSTARYVVA